jgi:hypothetical protein
MIPRHPQPPHVPVKSTNIKSVAYQPDSQMLQVRFHSGDTYNFWGVHPTVHDALMAATSKGKFFDQAIRNRYRSTLVRD